MTAGLFIDIITIFFFVENVLVNALSIKMYVISKFCLLSARIFKEIGNKSEYNLRGIYFFFFVKVF